MSSNSELGDVAGARLLRHVARDQPDPLGPPRRRRGPLGDGDQVRGHLDGGAVAGVDRAEPVAVLVEGVHPHAEGAEALDQAGLDLLQHGADVALAGGVADHLAGRRQHPDLVGERLALDGDVERPGRLLGVPVEDPAVRLVGAPAVGRAVDGQGAAELAVGAVERRDQQVEGVPGVVALDRLEVGHPAPALDLGVEGLVGDELEHAPVLRVLELLHQPGDRREGALQRLAGLVAARHRHHLHVQGVADHADRGHLEAGQLGDPLGDHQQRLVGGPVGPAGRLVHVEAAGAGLRRQGAHLGSRVDRHGDPRSGT